MVSGRERPCPKDASFRQAKIPSPGCCGEDADFLGSPSGAPSAPTRLANPGEMSHDHRLFAAASLIGTGSFLRGGEFLASPSSDRAVLRGKSLSRQEVAGVPAVVVQISQPKARWWIDSERVVCFEFDKDGPFNPVLALASYRDLSSVELPSFLRSVDRMGRLYLGTGWLP